jgi:hypothetical protein
MFRIGALPTLVLTAALPACGGEPDPAAGFLDHLYQDPLGEFAQVSSYDTTGGNRDRLEIAAGNSAVLLDIEGPGVIQRIWITVSSSDPHYLRRIALKMYWDGEPEPSVAVPLGDFFGNGFDKGPHRRRKRHWTGDRRVLLQHRSDPHRTPAAESEDVPCIVAAHGPDCGHRSARRSGSRGPGHVRWTLLERREL